MSEAHDDNKGDLPVIPDNWKDLIPQDYRDSTLIKETASVEDLAKFAVETQRMLGNSIRIPGENASEDDQSAFRTKLAEIGMIPKENAVAFLRPEKPEDYGVKEAPANAEVLGITQADVDNLKNRAHELGLSNDQFQDYAGRYFEDVKKNHDTQREKFESVDMALKGVWGEEAFQGKKQQALAAIRRFGGNELLEKLGQAPDAEALLAWSEVGKSFEESGMGDLTTPEFLPETRGEAATKLDEIERNKDHPFNRGVNYAGGKAVYEEAAKEVMRLRRIVMGLPGQTRDYMFSEA